MRRLVPAFLSALALLPVLASPALGQTPAPAPAALLAGLAGEWRGALEYRDYRSDRMERIPFERRIEAVGDGATVASRTRYNERNGVWIASLQKLEAGELETATFRAGRPAELGRDRVTLDPGATPERWTMRFERTGRDGDGDARIRETLMRDGDRLTSLKEVDPLGDGAETFLFRNRSVQTRVGG